MTAIDPKKRPSITEVLCNSWFAEGFAPEKIAEVHSEMDHRKQFMLKLLATPKHSKQ
jgi:hypothetical protein